MSRIGKRPVVLPAGVKVEAVNGVLTVTGKLGRLARPIPGKLAVEVKDGAATVVLLDKDAGNLYGMYRTILANMVQGVTEGFLRILEIVGVGYKAESKGGGASPGAGVLPPGRFPPAGGRYRASRIEHRHQAERVRQGSARGNGRPGPDAPETGRLQEQGNPLSRRTADQEGREGGGQIVDSAQFLTTGIRTS